MQKTAVMSLTCSFLQHSLIVCAAVECTIFQFSIVRGSYDNNRPFFSFPSQVQEKIRGKFFCEGQNILVFTLYVYAYHLVLHYIYIYTIMWPILVEMENTAH